MSNQTIDQRPVVAPTLPDSIVFAQASDPTKIKRSTVQSFVDLVQLWLSWLFASITGQVFTGAVSVPDDAYGAWWNGSVQVPTKNAVYDKIETLAIETTTTVSSATPTPTWWSLRNYYTITALATNATIGAPTGTPVDGNMILMRILDNSTARTLAWNSIYRWGDTTLPTTTISGKTMYLVFVYNSQSVKWELISKEDNH